MLSHTYIRTYIHTCIHTNIHTYRHTYIHAYIQTYIHTYIHTHIPVPLFQFVPTSICFITISYVSIFLIIRIQNPAPILTTLPAWPCYFVRIMASRTIIEYTLQSTNFLWCLWYPQYSWYIVTAALSTLSGSATELCLTSPGQTGTIK